MRVRVVFDTNCFTPQHFDILDSSPMRQLCHAGRIVAVYGHVFLEEMLRSYGNDAKRRDLATRWMPFLMDTAGRLNDDFVSIWHSELVCGRGVHARRFMPLKRQEYLFENCHDMPLDGTWKIWREVQDELRVENAKRAKMRELSKEVRLQVRDWTRLIRYSRKRHGVPVFADTLSSEADRSGREFIVKKIEAYNPVEVANRWSRAKDFYPYFTTFVQTILYMPFYASVYANDRIDLNAQADLDLMTHLLHADVLVSNEQGFLQRAFDDLWRPRGKVLMNSEQFVRFLRKLACKRAANPP